MRLRRTPRPEYTPRHRATPRTWGWRRTRQIQTTADQKHDRGDAFHTAVMVTLTGVAALAGRPADPPSVHHARHDPARVDTAQLSLTAIHDALAGETAHHPHLMAEANQ